MPLSVTEFKPRRISGAASVLRPGLLGAGRGGLNRDSLGRTVAVGVALAAPHRLFRSAPHCLVIYVRPRRWRLSPTWTHGGPLPLRPGHRSAPLEFGRRFVVSICGRQGWPSPGQGLTCSRDGRSGRQPKQRSALGSAVNPRKKERRNGERGGEHGPTNRQCQGQHACKHPIWKRTRKCSRESWISCNHHDIFSLHTYGEVQFVMRGSLVL